MHLEAVKDAVLNRCALQGNPILIYKVEKKEYRYVEFFSISSEQSSGECVASKFHSALKIAATSVARSFKTANDSSKSDQARAAAFDRKPGGKHAAKVLRNMSLICTSLIYGTENSFGQEKLAAVHLWSRVTRAMSNAFHMKNMFRPHYDELIAEWIGQRHHEISLIYSFGVVPNSAVFMRFQPFLMRKHRGKVLVQIMPQKSCLAPKIMGGCEASESFHQTVTKGLHSWTSLGEDAFKVVAEMINDLHIVYVLVAPQTFSHARMKQWVDQSQTE